MEKKYLCVIKNDPGNWIVDTLEKVKDWVIENWDIDEELKLIEVVGEFKELKIKTSIEL